MSSWNPAQKSPFSRGSALSKEGAAELASDPDRDNPVRATSSAASSKSLLLAVSFCTNERVGNIVTRGWVGEVVVLHG